MFIQAGMEKILSGRMDGGIGMARKSRKNRNVESNIQTVVKKENLKQLLENAELENLLLKINRKKLTIPQKIKYHLISDANMFMIYLYYIIGFKCKNRIKEMIGKK